MVSTALRKGRQGIYFHSVSFYSTNPRSTAPHLNTRAYHYHKDVILSECLHALHDVRRLMIDDEKRIPYHKAAMLDQHLHLHLCYESGRKRILADDCDQTGVSLRIG